ncbi:MAG: hypothetical protein GY731_18980 [Gammaproteobacteria bacterium]|nr:hypothetical protein [Gammaproteobacteria bacterium]
MSIGEVKQLIESLIEDDDMELDEFLLGEAHPLSFLEPSFEPDKGDAVELAINESNEGPVEDKTPPSPEQLVMRAAEEFSTLREDALDGESTLQRSRSQTGAPSFSQQLHTANRFEAARNTLRHAVNGA